MKLKSFIRQMISKRIFWFFNFRSNSFKKKQKPEQKKRQQVQFHETLASQKNHPCSSSLIYEIRPEGSQLRCEGRELHKAINLRWKKKHRKNCNYFSPDCRKTKNFLMVDNAVSVFFFLFFFRGSSTKKISWFTHEELNVSFQKYSGHLLRTCQIYA